MCSLVAFFCAFLVAKSCAFVVTDYNRAFRRNDAKKPRPSVRHFTSFMLQHQNLVANKHSIFYRFDEKEKREQTIEQFKIFAGYVDQEYFTKNQELNELEQELRKAEYLQVNKDKEKSEKVKELDLLLKEYIAVTGKHIITEKAENIILAPQKYNDLISIIKIEINEESNEFIQQLNILTRELNVKLSEKRTLENKQRDINMSIEYAMKYKKEIEDVYFIPDTKIHLSECPFCKNNNEKLIDEANKLEEAINWLNTELSKTPYLLDSFLSEQKKINKQIEIIKNDLSIVNKKIGVIININKELRKNRSLNEQGLKIKLKIENILENLIHNNNSSVTDSIGVIKFKINEIQNDLKKNYNTERKLQDAENYINQKMKQIGSFFDFEDSYKPINLKFDLLTFELCHLKADGRKVFLRSMGSGANWLYCHLTLFMSLHSYFCSLGTKCLIPPILFLDQPSQVYFPMSIDNKDEFDAKGLKEIEGKDDYIDDFKAVENFYSQLAKFCADTLEKTGIEPQIVITDHADKMKLVGADFESLVNGRRWRSKSDGFIKLEL